MPTDPIPALISGVEPEELRRNLFHLAKDPLPFRKLNYTLPGHDKCTLYEADDYIQGRLESWGYVVEREGVQVQAYRRDTTKNVHHQYSPPLPEDPWYTAYNLYAKKLGTTHPDEFIICISHKDSQSWIDSPGANDNAVGTVGNMELARVLAGYESQRSIWFVFCNEEHTPWTSMTAAENALTRGDKISAVFNVDGIGRKSPEDHAARRMTNVVAYAEDEGEAIADAIAQVNEQYQIGLETRAVRRPFANDDDGSYVKAGFPAAVIVIGSWPYGDPNYHLETDTPETVDVEHAALTVKAIIGAVVRMDGAA
jgi:hypothetical protein